jgi:hypothetical protein
MLQPKIKKPLHEIHAGTLLRGTTQLGDFSPDSKCAERGTSVNSKPVIQPLRFDRFAPSTGSLDKIRTPYFGLFNV